MPNTEAVVQYGKTRFTLLTDRMIRVEYSPKGDLPLQRYRHLTDEQIQVLESLL